MRSNRGTLTAELRSAVKPTEEQFRRFEKFLAGKRSEERRVGKECL